MRRRALSNFDGGRGLHKQYVHMVVTSRFPELYRKENDSGDEGGSNSDGDSDDEQLDMDNMRQKLSNLFQVCEVCKEEFQLIANVFSTPAPGKGGDATFELTSLSDAVPYQVARALVQRVISDPYDGLQARINDCLDSIDRRGGNTLIRISSHSPPLTSFVLTAATSSLLLHHRL